MDLPDKQTLDNALKLFGEAVVPGASLLMEGKIVSGSAHFIVGSWAKASLGPVAAAVVMANSYSESATGKSLIKHFAKFAEDIQSDDSESTGKSVIKTVSKFAQDLAAEATKKDPQPGEQTEADDAGSDEP